MCTHRSPADGLPGPPRAAVSTPRLRRHTREICSSSHTVILLVIQSHSREPSYSPSPTVKLLPPSIIPTIDIAPHSQEARRVMAVRRIKARVLFQADFEVLSNQVGNRRTPRSVMDVLVIPSTLYLASAGARVETYDSLKTDERPRRLCGFFSCSSLGLCWPGAWAFMRRRAWMSSFVVSAVLVVRECLHLWRMCKSLHHITDQVRDTQSHASMHHRNRPREGGHGAGGGGRHAGVYII